MFLPCAANASKKAVDKERMRPAVASGLLSGASAVGMALGPNSGARNSLMRSMAVRYSKVSDALPDWMETSIDACRICAFC
ncbi:hypothetical protein D3C71_1904420 [compost metagenome]